MQKDFIFLKNKNPYNRNMGELIFFMHMRLLHDRRKLRARI